MKSIFIALVTVFALTVGISQEAVEKNISMSLGPQNAFYVEIPGSDVKTAQKAFYDFVKEYGKLKENKKAREHFMMATKIPIINGSSPLDVYAKFEEGKGMATTYVWMDMGGAFINSANHANQSAALKQFMYDYFIAVRKIVVAEELKVEEKKLSDVEKDLKKLKDKNDDFHKDIEKAKQRIAEAERNIEKNLVDQENKTIEINAQKENVVRVTDKLNSLGKKN